MAQRTNKIAAHEAAADQQRAQIDRITWSVKQAGRNLANTTLPGPFIGGLLPLMMENSIQAQFLLPMATTLVLGLGIATLLVLFLVPAVVGIGEDLRRVFALILPRRPRAAPAE